MARRFDLVVIGGGSGGLAHAQRAAEYGASAAVVESGPLGGTCVNVGCVPKKVMWYAAHHAHAIRGASDFGFTVAAEGHDWSELKARRDAYISRLNDIYERNLDNRKVTLLRGTGQLVSDTRVNAGGEQLEAERIVIATGGQPIVPAIPGAELGITSDGFFELPERPARVALVGSGYVAVELAGVFAALGSETTVLVRKGGVLRSFDEMLRDSLHGAMKSEGIRLETRVVPRALERRDNGLVLLAEDGREFGSYDCVVWAIGREPNVAALQLDAAGVASDKYGFIPVDDYQATNVDNVFALGDVTGREALTPVAIAAGRRLADRLYGGMADRHLEYHTIPTVIFSHPPIGTVGFRESDAREKYGDDVTVYQSTFNPMLYALGEHKTPTSMKLITVGAEEKIVGCHVIGEGADEMLQGFAVAIRMGARKKDFDDTVAIHPTSAEEFVTMR
ncbi:MAG: glutathione-disulfide reductase [Gammaproteobacteria bacterium]|nr:glutathione-disulfide reductase [Gammaproteobacteria bacterium]